MLYCERQIKYPARLLSETLGYYSTLKNAVKVVKSRTRNSMLVSGDYTFRIFEVEEFYLDRWIDEPIQIRFYDTDGKFIDRYRWFEIFSGKNKEECKFQLGEIVEFLEYYKDAWNLKPAVVLKLPYDRAYVSKLHMEHKGFRLTACDGRYQLFTNYGIAAWDSKKMGYVIESRCGKASSIGMYMFHPSVKIPEKKKKELLNEYEKQKAKLS